MTEDCGLLNLATCIPQKIFDYILNLLIDPLAPFLALIKSLLTEPVNINLFAPLWAIIVYMLSLFYGLLLLYSGFNFILSGYDAAKREKAKEWLRNILIMVVLVQASFFIYSLVIDLNSLMTAGVMGLIDQNFFRLTTDNIINAGLQFFFTLMYLIVLLIAGIILTLRYLIVSAGVVFLPIGIFLYFIPPLRSYGKFVLNFFGTAIFLTFIDSILLLVCSKLTEIDLFSNFKILVMISAFALINLVMIYFMFFSALKAIFNFGKKVVVPVALAAKYLI